MGPRELSFRLRHLASIIESRGRGMSRVAAASAVAALLLATDKSLAFAVREALLAELEKIMPGRFELYDTNPDGKGYRAGYISFAIGPTDWKQEGIIGGILVQCSYNPKDFRSEAPENPGEDFRHSKGGGIIELSITGCYYNKLQGGGCDSEAGVGTVPLSGADVYIDAKEKVISIELVDADMTRQGIESIIKEISANPPDYAQSEKRKRRNNVPTGSPQSLQKWLVQQGRSDVGQSELEALARAISQRTGKAYSNALSDVTDYFRSKGWPVNPYA